MTTSSTTTTKTTPMLRLLCIMLMMLARCWPKYFDSDLIWYALLFNAYYARTNTITYTHTPTDRNRRHRNVHISICRRCNDTAVNNSPDEFGRTNVVHFKLVINGRAEVMGTVFELSPRTCAIHCCDCNRCRVAPNPKMLVFKNFQFYV